MLKNASSLAIVGLDTAENGLSKVRQVTNRIDAIIAERYSVTRAAGRDTTFLLEFSEKVFTAPAQRGRSLKSAFVMNFKCLSQKSMS